MKHHLFISIFLTFALAAVNASKGNSLSTEIVSRNVGRVSTIHVEAYDGKIYITGSVPKQNAGSSPHVHVELVDKKGNLVAFKWTNVDGINGKPATRPNGTYVVSFDPSITARATTVRVSYYAGPHVFCTEDSKSKG